MPLVYENILATVGNTPIVKLNKIGPGHVNLYVKIESFNPMASVKDRLALGVIENAGGHDEAVASVRALVGELAEGLGR